MDPNNLVYLDHHATTPVDPRVVEAMLPFLQGDFGNSGSPHSLGKRAEAAVEHARAQVARLIGAHPAEIVFTSDATESDNLALCGVRAWCGQLGDHLVTSPLEHKAVLECAEKLAGEGCRVTLLPVSPEGLVAPGSVARAIGPETLLVSVMLANNEIGTIAPIAEIGRVTRSRGVLFHCDAVQGLGKIPFDVNAMRVDLASISAHKMYGPKGIGALYARKSGPKVRLVAQLSGGGQERGVRPGTLAVHQIVGLGAAAEIAMHEGPEEAQRIGQLRDYMLELLGRELGDRLHVNGHPTQRLPGNLSIRIDGIDGRDVVRALDELWSVCASTGSACSKGIEPSHVLLALGLSEPEARSAVRFGLGRWTTDAEVEYAAAAVGKIVRQMPRAPSWSANVTSAGAADQEDARPQRTPVWTMVEPKWLPRLTQDAPVLPEHLPALREKYRSLSDEELLRGFWDTSAPNRIGFFHRDNEPWRGTYFPAQGEVRGLIADEELPLIQSAAGIRGYPCDPLFWEPTGVHRSRTDPVCVGPTGAPTRFG